jgi:uncharacterized protein (TIGR02246 family)
MNQFKNLLVLMASVVALAACVKTAPTANADADGTAIRAAQDAWYKAYNAGDGAAVAALYAEDAVLSPPNKPAAHGGAAIREYYLANAPAALAAGVTAAEGATSDVGVSGDVAWQSGTYTITNKAGTTVETGKTLTVFQRKDGKWVMLRDTWNSDAAPPAK